MRLNEIHLVNFRQHADTRISFDLGLTGIIGPNGSGKTTILEAIAWALYGNQATRGTRDSIRNMRAPARSPVRVELDFELSGHRYRVVRGLTSAELFLDAAAAPIASTISGVAEMVQRRLGMTRSEFFNTYFTGQKELNVMAAMGPSERAQFLSRVLGYEKLRTAQNLVRDRRRLLVAEVAGLRAAMPDADAVNKTLSETEARLNAALRGLNESDLRRTRCENAVLELEPRWRRAQEERERLQEVLSEMRVAESEEASHKRDLERLDRELRSVTDARAELTELARELLPLNELGEEFRRLETLAREEGKRQTLLENERVLAEEVARLRDRKSKLDTAPALESEVTTELEARRRMLEETSADLEAKRTEWVRDRQEAETKRDSLRAQYGDVKAQRERIVALGPEGDCPVCTRPLHDHFTQVLEQMTDQLETVRVDGRFYHNRLEQLQETPPPVKELDERRRTLTTEVSALERRRMKVQSAIEELAQLGRDLAAKERRHETVTRDLAAIPTGYDAARHVTVRGLVERLAPLNEKATRLSAQVERESELASERNAVEGRLVALHERVAHLVARRAAVQLSDADYLALRESHDRAVAEFRAAEIAAASAAGDAAAARAAAERAHAAQAELTRMQGQMATLQRDKRLHDELDRAYSDLRTDLNFQLRPELSELASGFISELTDARYTELELDDAYNVIVLEDAVPKPVISGGEEDLANLVLRLAISQMIAERAGQSFSLLVLDEIFGSLDEARRHNVVELLRQLQDRFEQVILITHIESVREGLDRVITVRYDEESGSSAVELVGVEVADPEAGDDDMDGQLELEAAS